MSSEAVELMATYLSILDEFTAKGFKDFNIKVTDNGSFYVWTAYKDDIQYNGAVECHDWYNAYEQILTSAQIFIDSVDYATIDGSASAIADSEWDVF